LVPIRHGLLSWMLSACAAVVVVWAIRDGRAALRLRRDSLMRSQVVRSA